MTEATFQKQILSRLENMEKNITTLKNEVGVIVDYIEDTKLSDEEKKLISEALKEEKEGKLLGKQHVFG